MCRVILSAKEWDFKQQEYSLGQFLLSTLAERKLTQHNKHCKFPASQGPLSSYLKWTKNNRFSYLQLERLNFVQTLVPELFGEDLQHGTNPRSQERVKHTHTHASASAAPLPLRSAELRGARIQHPRYAAAGHGWPSCASFPPPPHPVRQPSAPAGKGNPSPKPLEKKLNAKLPLPSTPSPVTLQKGGRYQLAACCRGQETLGTERSLRDGRAPRARRRAPLMAALPPGQPQAGIGHRAPLLPLAAATPSSLRHRRHGKLAPSGAAAPAHIGPTGRDGAGTGRGLLLKGHRPFLAAGVPGVPDVGGPCWEGYSGLVGASGLPHPGSQPA